MNTVYAKPGSTIRLGYQGETGVTTVVFDLDPFIKQFGEGSAQVSITRPNDPNTYPGVLEITGDKAIWKIGSEWTKDSGVGRCQLGWYVNGKIAKSEIYMTYVTPSIDSDIESDPPEPYETYLAEMQAIGAKTEAAASKAEEAVIRQPIIRTRTWWVWDPNAGRYADTGISAEAKDGLDGYTPVRGEDYWTPNDKTEIIKEVLEKVPECDGVKSVNGQTPDENGNVEIELPESVAKKEDLAAKITTPKTAQIGQTIVVKTVDESGKPAEWEAVDLPEGGGGNVYRATDYGISTEAEDNTPALQALIDSISASGGGIIFFPVGTYNFMRWNSSDYRWAVEMKSDVSIVGENIEKTVLKQTQATPYSLFGRILDNGEGAASPLTGCIFKNFTVDAYATGDVNHVCGKAFFFQYVRDCVFRDLRLLGTTATALGIDFLDRVVIDNVSCIDCGRTFTGTEAGTSGIGIGTAGWENENFIITNCICEGCGQYGIFIENQGIFYEGNVPYAKGCIISNCIVRNGINKGIGVRGGQNVTVIGCESYENASHGIYIDNNCKNVKVLSCSSANNGGAGICVEPNQTEHLLIKGCTFVNNQAEGIKVNVGAGKNADKLCVQDCYTDGNTVGLDLSATNLLDCVILGNATLDGTKSNSDFSGNTLFNDLIENGDTPAVDKISVPFSAFTNGLKLMPDGSIAEGGLNETFATEGYIDVTALNDVMLLRYPGTGLGAIRVAQYDSDKVSLGDSFGLNQPTQTTAEYEIWEISKLNGCRYLRLFLSGDFVNLEGELYNGEAKNKAVAFLLRRSIAELGDGSAAISTEENPIRFIMYYAFLDNRVFAAHNGSYWDNSPYSPIPIPVGAVSAVFNTPSELRYGAYIYEKHSTEAKYVVKVENTGWITDGRNVDVSKYNDGEHYLAANFAYQSDAEIPADFDTDVIDFYFIDASGNRM